MRLTLPPSAGHCRAVALSFALAAGGALAAPATIFELTPASPLHQSTTARGLNNLGQVVGVSSGRIDTGGVVFDQTRATFWQTPTSGAVTGQALPSDALAVGRAEAINDAGRIAGRVGDAAYRWAPQSDGSYVLGNPLPNLGTGAYYATDINAGGSIVGGYWKCASSDCGTGNFRAWRWNGITAAPVGTDVGIDTVAHAINAAGDVLVSNSFVGSPSSFAVHAADGSVTPVPMPPRVLTTSGGVDMNDSRQIAATRLIVPASGPALRQAFVWSQGVDFDLLHLNPTWGGSASAINNLGWVVGSERLDATTFAAALWVGTGLVFDLNDLLSPEDALLWSLEEAVDISDNGWITGNGWFTATPDADPVRRGWAMQLSADFIASLPPGQLFPPPGTVPEPGTLLLSVAAVLGVATSRGLRRRQSLGLRV